MTVKFWGVRGSFPTPHPHMLRYGGNTSCVSVSVDTGIVVIDAGTGARQLGKALLGATQPIYLLLTHLHNDHIEGFPFFTPLYHPGHRVHLIDYRQDRQAWSPLAMLDGVHYPMRPSSIVADYVAVSEFGPDYLCARGLDVSAVPANHPGGAYGYRVAHRGRVFVHIPDNELNPPDSEHTVPYAEFVRFCRGADVLSHDAMYTSDDLPAKWGWGHSQLDQTCQLAIDAGVRHLVLFHHDPERTDDAIDTLQDRARARLQPHGIECTAAYEGLTFNLGG
ncbi:MAG: MBL fold metallo-hydrolase [Rhodothermales bacterium]|nr:MBL fold metallo-hydrolase [Rhodothermales bacterium]